MILDAQQVQDLKDSELPTDWSKFGSTVSAADFNRGMFTGDEAACGILHAGTYRHRGID